MSETPSRIDFDARMHALGGWRAEMMRQVREIILGAHSDVNEAIKWVKPTSPDGALEWSHAGGICTGEVYRDKVKLTFHKGASLPDPSALFNSSLEGRVRRAIDLTEGARIDTEALADLIRAAITFNEVSKRR